MNYDTDQGLNVPTMAQVEQSFVQAINTYVSPSFTLTNSNILSQVIIILSQQLTTALNTLQVCFDVLNPSSAQGINLDDAANYVGVVRAQALPTEVYLLLTAETTTVFPATTSLTSGEFTISNTTAATIQASNCAQAKVTVTGATYATLYSLSLNDILVSYTAIISDTPTSIAAALVTAIDTQAPLFVASHSGAVITINLTTNSQVDYSQSFSIVIDSGQLALTNFSAYTNFYNSVTGPVAIPANTFDLGSTGVSGVSCTQPLDGIIGNNADTDQDLRIRRDLSLSVGGNRTISAIRSALLNPLTTPYVDKAQVYQNITNSPVAITESLNLLPHSIYAVVLGGYSVNIATSIYNRMSEGIETNGSTSVTIVDENNNPIIINFDYCTQIAISVSATINIDKSLLYKIDKNINADAQAAVFQNIQGLGIGETMYVADLVAAIGSVIQYGIRSIDVTYIVLPSGSPTSSDLDVEANQIAVCDFDNIVIEVIAT